MVGYFRKQNFLLILLGALSGLLAAFLMKRDILAIVVFPVIGGGIGRLVCGIWANKRVEKWNEILFGSADPKRFLEVFLPVLERTARKTTEYADGCNKVAYAYEALGDFDQARAFLNKAEPELLPGKQGLNARTTTYSNRTRVLLLMGDREGAAESLKELRQVSDAAMLKNQRLGHAGRHYIRLYENWLSVLNNEDTDEDFVREEIKLSANRIRNSELLHVLAKAALNRGDRAQAEELWLEAMSEGSGLWAENEARKRLASK